MEWRIEARASAGGATVTVASHEPVMPIVRRHHVSHAVVGFFPSLPPRTSRARFVGATATEFRPIGNLLVIPPGTELEVRTNGEERRRMIWCHIESAGLDAGELAWLRDRSLSGDLLDLRSSAVAGLMRELAKEATVPALASAMRIEGLSLILLVELARLFDRHGVSSKGGLAPWQLRQVERMLTDFHATPSPADLASACGLSERHLMRAFRQSTGASIGEYSRAVRLQAAQDLLADTRTSISDVAVRLGFASPSAFSNFMKKALGVSPRSYRQHLVARPQIVKVHHGPEDFPVLRQQR